MAARKKKRLITG